MFLDTFTNLSVLELVKFYHSLKPNLKYKEICSIINKHHHRLITMNMVKRICKEENLSRRRNISDSDLKDVIVNELKTSMSKVGYRQMWEQISLKYDVNVSKECVRKILKAVDPKGVEERRSKTIKRRIYWSNGPGDIFHIDCRIIKKTAVVTSGVSHLSYCPHCYLKVGCFVSCYHSVQTALVFHWIHFLQLSHQF